MVKLRMVCGTCISPEIIGHFTNLSNHAKSGMVNFEVIACSATNDTLIHELNQTDVSSKTL